MLIKMDALGGPPMGYLGGFKQACADSATGHNKHD